MEETVGREGVRFAFSELLSPKEPPSHVVGDGHSWPNFSYDPRNKSHVLQFLYSSLRLPSDDDSQIMSCLLFYRLPRTGSFIKITNAFRT